MESKSSPKSQKVSTKSNKKTPATKTKFNSNPFISFSQGLGSGLQLNGGAIFGNSFLALAIILVGGFITAIVSGVIAASIPAVGFLLSLIPVLLLLAVFLIPFGRSLAAYNAASKGQHMPYKETASHADLKTGFLLLGGFIVTFVLTFLGLLLFIIPGIYIFARLSLIPFIIVNEKLGVPDAFLRSWKLTKGHVWELIGSSIVQTLTLGYSILFMGMYAGYANRYAELVENEKAGGGPTGKIHPLNYVVPLVIGALVAAYFLVIIIATIATSNNIQKANDANSGTLSQYCYYDGEFSSANTPEYKCVSSPEECNASTYCQQTYRSFLD